MMERNNNNNMEVALNLELSWRKVIIFNTETTHVGIMFSNKRIVKKI